MCTVHGLFFSLENKLPPNHFLNSPIIFSLPDAISILFYLNSNKCIGDSRISSVLLNQYHESLFLIFLSQLIFLIILVKISRSMQTAMITSMFPFPILVEMCLKFQHYFCCRLFLLGTGIFIVQMSFSSV